MSDEKPREFWGNWTGKLLDNGNCQVWEMHKTPYEETYSPKDEFSPVHFIEYSAYDALLKERDALQKERDVLTKAIQIANKYLIKIIKGRYDCPHDNMAECALDEIKELEKMDHAKK